MVPYQSCLNDSDYAIYIWSQNIYGQSVYFTKKKSDSSALVRRPGAAGTFVQ